MAGPTAFRDWLQPLEIVLRIDAAFDRGVLIFRSGRRRSSAALDLDGPDRRRRGLALHPDARGAIEDTARAVILRYVDGLKDYERGAALVSIEAGLEDGIAEADTPLVLDKDRATVVAETILRTSAAARERFTLALPPSAEAVRPGSLFSLDLPRGRRRTNFWSKRSRAARRSRSRRRSIRRGPSPLRRASTARRPALSSRGPRRSSPPSSICRSWPARTAADHVGFIAAHAAPWPGGFDAYRSAEETDGLRLQHTRRPAGDDRRNRDRPRSRPALVLVGRDGRGPAFRRLAGHADRTRRSSPARTRSRSSIRRGPGKSCNSRSPSWSAIRRGGSPGCCAGNAEPRARAGPRRSRRGLGLWCSTSRSPRSR